LSQYYEEGDASVLQSLVTKHGSAIMSQRANARIWNGNTQHPLSKGSSNLSQQQGEWCLHFSDIFKDWSL